MGNIIELVEKRTQEDKCIVKRLYDMATPYIQIAGFVILCAFTVGVNWDKVAAYEDRIKALEDNAISNTSKIDKLDGKMEVLLNYLNVPHRK